MRKILFGILTVSILLSCTDKKTPKLVAENEKTSDSLRKLILKKTKHDLKIVTEVIVYGVISERQDDQLITTFCFANGNAGNIYGNGGHHFNYDYKKEGINKKNGEISSKKIISLSQDLYSEISLADNLNQPEPGYTNIFFLTSNGIYKKTINTAELEKTQSKWKVFFNELDKLKYFIVAGSNSD